MKNYKNNSGFTLINVMIAAGLLSGLSMAFISLTENMKKSEIDAQSKAEILEVKRVIELIVSDENHCRVSLAGPGQRNNPTTPQTFNKTNIDDTSNNNEGKAIILYLSRQDGVTRGNEKLKTGGKYGDVNIVSLKLYMNSSNNGLNYDEALIHQDLGIIQVITARKISIKSTRNNKMEIPLNVVMKTDANGLTSILSCGPQVVTATAISNQITVLPIHSQESVSFPGCPSGMRLLWNGYSFMGVSGNEHITASADLGEPGSCLERFIGMPVAECKYNGKCEIGTTGDYALWLSASSIDTNISTAEANDSRIGKCSVCEIPGPVITRHKQFTFPPVCPSGWSKLWDGFSFIMASAGPNGFNSFTDLGKSGSCLPKFTPIPFVECSEENTEYGKCDYITNNDFGYWLSTTSRSNEETYQNFLNTKISRCIVCYKN